MPTAKRIIKSMTPPFLWAIGKDLKRRWVHEVDYYAYAPGGSATPLSPGDQDFWSSYTRLEREGYQQLTSRVAADAPLFADAELEAVRHAMYGYALGLVSRQKHKPSVLDYGGNLGQLYWYGRSLMPGIELDYHCKELPPVAEAGRAINPAVKWHTDDRCFARPYDLVMFLASLQFVEDWQDTLRRAAHCTQDCLLLDIAAVRNAPTFSATQRFNSLTHVFRVVNRAEVVALVEAAGLRLRCEFTIGPHPPVANAPEQPTVVCWVFQRPAII